MSELSAERREALFDALDVQHDEGCRAYHAAECCWPFRGAADALAPLIAGWLAEAKGEAWDACVAWMAYQGQADVKGWLLEAAEQENPYRAEASGREGES